MIENSFLNRLTFRFRQFKRFAHVISAVTLIFCSSEIARADDDIAARDWSTTISGTVAQYPPGNGELTSFINRIVDSSYTMNVCSARFVDVYDGTYRLVASLDVNGRRACNRIVVIQKTKPAFHVINDLQAVRAGSIPDMLQDLDNDRSPELVITQAWSRAETGKCLAVWQKIYKWNGRKFADKSADYPQVYKERLKQLRTDIKYEKDPDCVQMEMDRIVRLLGTTKAGYDRAVAWRKSTKPFDRRKAATVFADIGDESSKKNLAVLAIDADLLSAESARRDLEPRTA
ncbi:MAG: hypothetical protein AB7H77_01060, partial [Bdellovibrionales bacterium]